MAVASLGLDGRILDANDALVTASGYTRTELLGEPFGRFMGPAADEEERGHFAALVAGARDAYRVERRFRTRSGEVREVDLSVSLVRDADGRPDICLAVLQDVTAHKRALEDAAHRAAQLEAIIHSLPAAIFIGHERGITLANDIALEQLGFATAGELNRPMAEISAHLQNRDADTGERIEWQDEPFVRALHGEHVDRELISRHLVTGEDVVHRVVAAPVRLGGRTIGAVAISTNITDRRRTEEALKLSEARYRAVIEQSPLSIQVLSPNGSTLEVNAAWERLWRLRFEDLAGYNILEDKQLMERGIMPQIRRAFAGVAAEVPASRYDPRESIAHLTEPSDAARWVRAVIYPIKDGRGRVREVVMIHEDISDRVRAELERKRVAEEREQLLRATQRAHQEVEAASRIKDEFLATLSHELRTPLNAVIGWARILRGGELDTRIAHGLDVIDRNAWAQARMIDDLLDVSRIATGNIRLVIEPVDVGQLALSAVESLKPAADAKGIELTTRIVPGLPPLPADPQRLQQVIWNLVANSVKFTDEGGRVELSVERDPRAIVIMVSDTGSGISPTTLPHIFEPFTQGELSNTRTRAGLGLGLAIVRHVVELHGGDVSAYSAGPERGSTFRVLLPLQ